MADGEAAGVAAARPGGRLRLARRAASAEPPAPPPPAPPDAAAAAEARAAAAGVRCASGAERLEALRATVAPLLALAPSPHLGWHATDARFPGVLA
jgi:hypothetical protein